MCGQCLDMGSCRCVDRQALESVTAYAETIEIAGSWQEAATWDAGLEDDGSVASENAIDEARGKRNWDSNARARPAPSSDDSDSSNYSYTQMRRDTENMLARRSRAAQREYRERDAQAVLTAGVDSAIADEEANVIAEQMQLDQEAEDESSPSESVLEALRLAAAACPRSANPALAA
jgi:hypothetical protein